MRLADYLNAFSWSQKDLARAADISVSTVSRALNGGTITRRNANAIVGALDKRLQAQGAKGHVTLASVRGLHISMLKRKRTRSQEQEEETEEEATSASDLEASDAYKKPGGKKSSRPAPASAL